MAIYPPNQPEEIRGISLCAGVAGLDIGVHIAEPRYRTVCYVERNSFASSALVARMADACLDQALIWDDLKSFDGKPWRGRVHLVTAGYPCQPFTYAGLRQGEHDPRHLWPDVARIVKEIAPEQVFFENVIGHLSLGFQDVINDLQEIGYRVAARVVSAAEVGGSHTRERVFIMGHADSGLEWQPCLSYSKPQGDAVQNGREPDRHPDRVEEPSPVLDVALANTGRGGLAGQLDSIFPPQPSDFVEWRKTRDRRPALKPCLHRLDYGLAFGVTDPLQPVTVWSHWLQHMRGALCELNLKKYDGCASNT